MCTKSTGHLKITRVMFKFDELPSVSGTTARCLSHTELISSSLQNDSPDSCVHLGFKSFAAVTVRRQILLHEKFAPQSKHC